jgi:chemotaxis protein methyltransferase CheR
MSVLDFEYLRTFLRERSGLVLAPDRQYLAESRLLPVARAAGLTSVAELVQTLRRPETEALATQVVEAMTRIFFLPGQKFHSSNSARPSCRS